MDMLKKWIKKLYSYYIHVNGSETGSLEMMALERNMELEDEWEGCENSPWWSFTEFGLFMERRNGRRETVKAMGGYWYKGAWIYSK
jgi:hypothetical protein